MGVMGSESSYLRNVSFGSKSRPDSVTEALLKLGQVTQLLHLHFSLSVELEQH